MGEPCQGERKQTWIRISTLKCKSAIFCKVFNFNVEIKACNMLPGLVNFNVETRTRDGLQGCLFQ